MKTAAVLIASLATAAAFAPAQVSTRVGTDLQAAKKPEAEKKPFFNTVFGMDLFAPNPDVNTYGARAKKNVSLNLVHALLVSCLMSCLLTLNRNRILIDS